MSELKEHLLPAQCAQNNNQRLKQLCELRHFIGSSAKEDITDRSFCRWTDHSVGEAHSITRQLPCEDEPTYLQHEENMNLESKEIGEESVESKYYYSCNMYSNIYVITYFACIEK